MHATHSKLIAESERLKRELFTQKELLKQAEGSYNQHMQTLKDKIANMTVNHQQAMESKSMEYEDLRELCSNHYIRINELEAIEGSLKFQLKNETLEKLDKIEQLQVKSEECVSLEQQLADAKNQIEGEKEKLVR